MDQENNGNRTRNLWKERGRRGGLTENESHRRNTGRNRTAHSASESRESRRTIDDGSMRRTAGDRGTRESRRTADARETGENLRTAEGQQTTGNRRPTETVRTGSRYADKNRETAAASTRGRKHEKRGGERNTRRNIGRNTGKNTETLSLWRDPVKLSLLCLGAVAVIAYVVAAFYYGSHFYSGATIYGIDCSKMTAAQVKEEVREKIGDYVLTVAEREDRQDTITAEQIGLRYQDDNTIEQQLKRQNCFVWPVMMLLGKNTDPVINTTYDRDSIDAVLKQMNCFLPGNVIAPVDAHRGDTEDGYEVVAEVMGTTLDYEKTKNALLDALDRGVSSISLEEAGCYIDPVIYQDDPELNAEVEELNSLLTARITYDFSDRQEQVKPSVIKGWIAQAEDGSYYIDDNQIWAYVAELADKYDTFGRERTFYTSVGTAVTLSGGDYGWCMDQDATAQILSEAVKAGRTETIEPEYIYTGMSREENDIGGTYVEVCISQQEMWCYQDGYLVVDTPVVTGNPNKGNGTPSGGVWAIDAKMQEYVLRGEGYAAPVDYWMPFNGDVGIHDMQNRAYFGGSIYLSNGSHGCVNTPYDAAQTIYNTVSIGTPVVVYE